MRGAAKAYFSGEVLEDSGAVHSCCGSYTTVAGCASFQVPVDTTHWELAGDKTQGGGYESNPGRNKQHDIKQQD